MQSVETRTHTAAGVETAAVSMGIGPQVEKPPRSSWPAGSRWRRS